MSMLLAYIRYGFCQLAFLISLGHNTTCLLYENRFKPVLADGLFFILTCIRDVEHLFLLRARHARIVRPFRHAQLDFQPLGPLLRVPPEFAPLSQLPGSCLFFARDANASPRQES
jgi:hypothetical protein